MEIMTGLGWLAAAYMGTLTVPAQKLNDVNDWFASQVDAGHSCFDRVNGTPGVYGDWCNYSLDPLCNYRLRHVPGSADVKVWTIVRDG